MSRSDLSRLASDLRSDASLGAEFGECRDNAGVAVRLAAANGYRLTSEEAEELLRSFDELSDDDLDQAAGGAWNDPTPPTGTSGTG